MHQSNKPNFPLSKLPSGRTINKLAIGAAFGTGVSSASKFYSNADYVADSLFELNAFGNLILTFSVVFFSILILYTYTTKYFPALEKYGHGYKEGKDIQRMSEHQREAFQIGKVNTEGLRIEQCPENDNPSCCVWLGHKYDKSFELLTSLGKGLVGAGVLGLKFGELTGSKVVGDWVAGFGLPITAVNVAATLNKIGDNGGQITQRDDSSYGPVTYASIARVAAFNGLTGGAITLYICLSAGSKNLTNIETFLEYFLPSIYTNTYTRWPTLIASWIASYWVFQRTIFSQGPAIDAVLDKIVAKFAWMLAAIKLIGAFSIKYLCTCGKNGSLEQVCSDIDDLNVVPTSDVIKETSIFRVVRRYITGKNGDYNDDSWIENIYHGLATRCQCLESWWPDFNDSLTTAIRAIVGTATSFYLMVSLTAGFRPAWNLIEDLSFWTAVAIGSLFILFSSAFGNFVYLRQGKNKNNKLIGLVKNGESFRLFSPNEGVARDLRVNDGEESNSLLPGADTHTVYGAMVQ